MSRFNGYKSPAFVEVLKGELLQSRLSDKLLHQAKSRLYFETEVKRDNAFLVCTEFDVT